MSIINDESLVYLLGLGFHIDLCKQALKVNSTLEDAIEWLLDPSRPPTTKIEFTKPIASSSSSSSSMLSIPILSEKEKENENSKLLQQKEFKRLTDELNQEKRREKEAKKKILIDIEQDKERRRRIKQRTWNERQQQQKQNIDKSALSLSETQNFAYIQFKLTDFSIVREYFPVEATVKDVLFFVLDKEMKLSLQQDLSIENISLDRTFPRKSFTIQDGLLNMHEAEFLPNVALNVKLIQFNATSTDETIHQEDTNGSMNDTSESLNDVIHNEMDTDDNEDIFDLNHLNAILHPHQTFLWNETVETGHRLTDPSPSSHLNDENNSTANSSIEEEEEEMAVINRRSNFLNAFENRRLSLVHEDNSNPQHKIAESLLDYLVKNGKLNVSTLSRLAKKCYLQNVVLDSYQYCTNSLVDELAKSNSSLSVTRLSLRGCDIVTDHGIHSLTGLKHLNYLDLSNCKVTDKGLKSLENLYNLSYLNLSKTKITDHGLLSMTVNAKFKDRLEILILDGCLHLNKHMKENNILVSIINGFTHLLQLSLAYTYIQHQQQELRLRKDPEIKLKHLDLSHTCLLDRDIIHIVCQLHMLIELKLGGCEFLTTRKLTQLRYIQFPNREHKLDNVLSKFKDLPLDYLDLTGFFNVTDEGLQSIACMKKLRYLSLDGTKVSDEGIVLLKGI
ncbi:uncharacterized protein BX663DRAFT_556096 [Cokeromyces recurvatus]|uniref:uncharacterized protein n=1 Tax=Cokeromyces recurvatus TaxID=90255 RepID=UPI00221E7F68|nr:uncharacterized protein BX663DRAFT_556096 [Cokeromyces recurvatus]KAI7898145.1 hypothetical protein BX663DRAFT_556096 [Cokeromyces recurvatus]